MPFYTRLLTPEDYGIWGVLLAYQSFLGAFFQLGLHDAFGRYHFMYVNDKKVYTEYFSTIVYFLCILSIFNIAFLSIFTGNISSFLFKTEKFSSFIILMTLDLSLSLLAQLFTFIFMWKEKPLHFAMANLTKALSTILLSIYLVIGLGKGIIGFIFAYVSIDLLYCLILLWLFRRYFVFRISVEKLIKSLEYGFAFFLTHLIGWVNTNSSNIFLTKIQSVHYAGLYTVAASVGSILGFITFSIQQVWYPFSMKNLEERGEGFYDKIAKFQTLYVFFICICCLTIGLFSKEIFILLMNKKYYEGWKIVPILTYYFLFAAMNQQFHMKLCYVKKTKVLFLSAGISACLSVMSNIILISLFPIEGSSLSLLFTMLVMTGVNYVYSQKYMKIHYNYRKDITIGTLFIFAVYLVYLFNYSLLVDILIKVGIILSFIIVCIFTVYGKFKLKSIKELGWAFKSKPSKLKEFFTDTH